MLITVWYSTVRVLIRISVLLVSVIYSSFPTCKDIYGCKSSREVLPVVVISFRTSYKDSFILPSTLWRGKAAEQTMLSDNINVITTLLRRLCCTAILAFSRMMHVWLKCDQSRSGHHHTGPLHTVMGTKSLVWVPFVSTPVAQQSEWLAGSYHRYTTKEITKEHGIMQYLWLLFQIDF